MSPYRKILSQSSAYSIGTILGKFSSFLLMPVYTRALQVSDYGLLEMLNISISVLGLLIGMRFGDALLFFHANAETAAEKKRAAASAFAGAILCGLAVAAGAFVAAPVVAPVLLSSSRYVPHIRLACLSLAISLPSYVVYSYLRAIDNPRVYTICQIAELGATVVLNVIFLLVMRMGVIGVLWGGVAGPAAVLVVLGVWMISRCGFSFDRRSIVSQMLYAAPLGLSGLSMLALHYGDRFFLQRSVSLAGIGLYSLAYKWGMVVSLVQMPFTVYWSAQMFRITKEKNGDEVYVRLFSYLMIVLSFVAVGISLYIRPVLRIMAAEPYRSADVYVPWIALAYVLRAAGDQFRSPFNIYKKTHKHAVVTGIAAGICLLAYAVLVPRYLLWGAVGATVAGFGALAFLSWREAEKVKSYAFEWRRLASLAAYAGLAVLAYHAISPSSFWTELAVATALMAVFSLLLLYGGVFRVTEREEIYGILSGVLRPLRPQAMMKAAR